MIQLIVHGATGRMGRLVCALAQHDGRFRVAASISRGEPARDARDADGVIDFSSDAGAAAAAALAVRCDAALLVGTTGLSGQTLDVLDHSARSVPVMVAPNTSLGVAVLNRLAAEAARLLGPLCEIDVTEQHHRHKRDAPSGTALRLVEAVTAATGRPLPPERVHSVRAGEIVGDHEIQFTLGAERLRIAHSVGRREVFAQGALDALAWLVGRPPGRYTIEQALGDSLES